MRCLIVSIILCISYQVLGQGLQDTEKICVYYKYMYRTAEEQKIPSKNVRVLSLGEQSSIFHYQSDSLDSKNAFQAVWNRIYKNLPQKGDITCRDFWTYKYYYIEPIPQYHWEVLDGDSVVCDYPCQKARTDFRGRTWIVWYTMDLPYNDGPWKLCGLPGLILKADDTKGDFSFTAFKISKGSGNPYKLELNRFKKIRPQDLEEDIREYMANPSLQDKGWDFSATPELAAKAKTACFIEYYNNK